MQILATAKPEPITQESEVVVAVNGSQWAEAGGLTYPFPLRPGVVVTMSFPVDLTSEESRRLARFIESLTIELGAAQGRPSTPGNLRPMEQ